MSFAISPSGPCSSTSASAPRSLPRSSEPLFDSALDVNSLAKLITTTKSQLSQYGIQLTLSDMPYGFQINNNAPQIFSAMDILSINSLPCVSRPPRAVCLQAHSFGSLR